MTDHPHVMNVSEFDYLRPETYEGAYSRLGEPSVMLKQAERDVAFLATAHRQVTAERDDLAFAFAVYSGRRDPWGLSDDEKAAITRAIALVDNQPARLRTGRGEATSPH